MDDRVKITDQVLIDVLRDLIDNAKDQAELGLELGKLVVPTISLNSKDLSDFFTLYYHSAALGAGALFVPPANTIIFNAQLGAKQKLDIYEGAAPVVLATESMGANEYGYFGLMLWCDGTNIKFKNTDAGAAGLILWGLTLGL